MSWVGILWSESGPALSKVQVLTQNFISHAKKHTCSIISSLCVYVYVCMFVYVCVCMYVCVYNGTFAVGT
jgi:hypothetical protein